MRIRVEPDRPRTFSLTVRIPGWCRGAPFTLNGEPTQLPIDHGYAAITREWHVGDTVDFDLPMQPEHIECNPLVQENLGRLALQCGPIVYCLEQADNPSGVFELALARGGKITAQYNPDLLGGVVVLEGAATRISADECASSSRPAPALVDRPESESVAQRSAGDVPGRSAWSDELYRRTGSEVTAQATLNPEVVAQFKAIPYFAWDNRSPGEMLVWVREIGGTRE